MTYRRVGVPTTMTVSIAKWNRQGSSKRSGIMLRRRMRIEAMGMNHFSLKYIAASFL
jgi:hypothetical protein